MHTNSFVISYLVTREVIDLGKMLLCGNDTDLIQLASRTFQWIQVGTLLS